MSKTFKVNCAALAWHHSVTFVFRDLLVPLAEKIFLLCSVAKKS